MALPAGKAVQAAKRLHHFGPRPEHQVVGIGQHDFGAGPVEVLRRQETHRSPGTNWHEARSGKAASSRLDPARPRSPVSAFELERGAAQARPTTMASPNDKNLYPFASARAYKSRQRRPAKASSSTRSVLFGWWKFVMRTSTTKKWWPGRMYSSVRPWNDPVAAADSKARTAVVPTAHTLPPARLASWHASQVCGGTL